MRAVRGVTERQKESKKEIENKKAARDIFCKAVVFFSSINFNFLFFSPTLFLVLYSCGRLQIGGKLLSSQLAVFDQGEGAEEGGCCEGGVEETV